MSIKILGGVAKGFTLATPHESITRPTSILLKRRLFDYFQNLDNFIFYDLCAGSGAIGFEALSRGAIKSVLVESNIKAFKTLQMNARNLNQKYPNFSIEIQKLNFEKWLENYLKCTPEQNAVNYQSILFFDPPYENLEMYKKFFDQLNQYSFKGIAIVEACRQKTMTQTKFEQCFGKPDRNYQQGTSFLYLYDYNK